MIFLSKDGEDEYVNMLAAGYRTLPTSTDDFVYEDSKEPIVLRGILKHKIMKRCWQDGRDFYYIDTGYFGNERTATNPNGWKYWHRIVKNDLQHSDLINVVQLFKQDKVIEGRKELLQYLSFNPSRIEAIYKWMYDNLELWGTTQSEKDTAIIIIRNGLANLSLVGIPEINLAATLIELTSRGN